MVKLTVKNMHDSILFLNKKTFQWGGATLVLDGIFIFGTMSWHFDIPILHIKSKM